MPAGVEERRARAVVPQSRAVGLGASPERSRSGPPRPAPSRRPVPSATSRTSAGTFACTQCTNRQRAAAGRGFRPGGPGRSPHRHVVVDATEDELSSSLRGDALPRRRAAGEGSHPSPFSPRGHAAVGEAFGDEAVRNQGRRAKLHGKTSEKKCAVGQGSRQVLPVYPEKCSIESAERLRKKTARLRCGRQTACCRRRPDGFRALRPEASGTRRSRGRRSQAKRACARQIRRLDVNAFGAQRRTR